MSENPPHPDDLAGEFRSLGIKLVDTLQALWENPERARIQQEIESGIGAVLSALREEARDFNESPSGQRLRTDLENIRQRVRSGELENQVRQDLLKALQMANQELDKVAQRFDSRAKDGTENPGE